MGYQTVIVKHFNQAVVASFLHETFPVLQKNLKLPPELAGTQARTLIAAWSFSCCLSFSKYCVSIFNYLPDGSNGITPVLEK